MVIYVTLRKFSKICENFRKIAILRDFVKFFVKLRKSLQISENNWKLQKFAEVCVAVKPDELEYRLTEI